MSPTIFREGPFRFYFFPREETRMHVHVHATAGEAKFWLEPRIELARNYGFEHATSQCCPSLDSGARR
jgi:hypothetical protein